MHLWPNGTAHLCCTSDANLPLGTIKQSTKLKDVWNGINMRRVRRDMLSGTPLKECSRCYEIERSGLRSMRMDHNLNFAHHQHLVSSTGTDGSVAQVNMPYMDIRFSNICNFRCRTCGPELSSSWFKDAKAIGQEMQHNTPLLHPSDDPATLWQQVEEILPTVEIIYFAGGEPLIMEEHYRILNWLIENGKTDVELRYNTNFSITSFHGQSVFQLWKKFRKVEVGASLDSFGSRAEYMRKETNWAQIESNRQQMLKICPEVGFYVNLTLSVFSLWTMAEFHRDWIERGLLGVNDWNINPLTYPLHYRVHILPLEERQRVMRLYQDHIDWLKQSSNCYPSSIERWRSAIAFLEGEQLTSEIAHFRSVTRSLDVVRNEELTMVFPELAHIYHG